MARSVDVGSFELLLDTITNAFGGILFIAILVVIMLQLSGKRELEKPTAELDEIAHRRMERQMSELAQRREQLRRALELQGRIIQDFAPDDSREALERLNKSKVQREDLATRRDKLLNEVQDERTQIGKVVRESSQLDQELASASRDLNELKSAHQREIESRTKTANMPMARRTSKLETVVIVRYGRLYVPFRTIEDRLAGRVNSEDMAGVGEDASEVTLTPKPYAGLPLVAAASLKRDLATKLSGYEPGRFYLCVAIWNDSFDRFEHFKEALIALGFEYRLILLTDGGKVSEGPVKDVLVQ